MMVGIGQVYHVGREAMQIIYHGLGMGYACDGQQFVGVVDAGPRGCIKHGLGFGIGDGGEKELLVGQELKLFPDSIGLGFR